MVKVNSKSQSGRSMVEMLGVLAIIGVLSVGGINAYSVAMEKIKTNDLLAQVRQEAVLIAAQLATGKTNLTLSADNTIFTSVSMDEGSDNFTLTLSDIEEELCNNVKSMLGSNSMVQSINDDCSEMTFHKNLILKSATQSGGSSGGDSGTESGGNSGGSTEPADSCADIDCGDHGSCVDGVCECEEGYDGENCEIKLTMFQCGADNNVKSDGLIYGYCDELGGCKVQGTLVAAEKWSELCNQELSDGYYVCRYAVSFGVKGMVEESYECEDGCNPGVYSNPEDACMGGFLR